VVADVDGNLSYVEGHSKAGDHVDLRFEMDTLVILNTCQHPLHPSQTYDPRPVKLSVFPTAAPTTDDATLTVRPENARAYRNTLDYYQLSR
jgi:uncharacterized protein